jgi:hypothetical protein
MRDPSEPVAFGSRGAVASPIPSRVNPSQRERSWTLTTAILLLVAAHAFDYVSFLVMTSKHGLAAELNPVVVRIAEDLGLPGLTIAKVASVVFLASVVVLVSPQRRRVAGTLAFVGISAGLLGGVSNIASI